MTAAVIAAPDWLLEQVCRRSEPEPASVGVGEPTAAAVVLVDVSTLDVREQAYLKSAYTGELQRLDAMSEAATATGAGYTGPPWDVTCFQVACNLVEIANAGLVSMDVAWQNFAERAPRDKGFSLVDHRRIWESAIGRVGDARRTIPAAPVDDFPWQPDDPFAPSHIQAAADPTTGEQISTPARPDLDVTSSAVAFDQLQRQLGTGPLSGAFQRGAEAVSTARVGESGYVPLTSSAREHDGPAQVRVVTSKSLTNAIQTRHRVVKVVESKDGPKTVRTMFPENLSALVLADLDSAPNLRPLRAVVHTPVMRPDGTVLATPGYDQPTGMLYLPDPGAPVPTIPEHPTAEQVQSAARMVATPLQDFPFVTEHDRVNYLGMMLTPLVRALVPPPYKLGVIEGPNAGVGKTLLSKVLTTLHGGVQRVGIPDDDAELVKVLTAILDTTTAPVVVFDNVTGVVRSAKLAGLFTSDQWNERRLGFGKTVTLTNDRLWVMTGNNASLGGDLTRRALRIRIDPGAPLPHLRTGFAIADLKDWTRQHRGQLLWSLLVLARAWVVAGRPVEPLASSDDYGPWEQLVGGILTHAGFTGRFGSRDIAPDAVAGADDSDWGDFLRAVQRAHGTTPWTAKDLLTQVYIGDGDAPLTRPIPYEALPSDLVDRRRQGQPVTELSRSLGKFLANRRGRWVDGLCVVEAGKRRDDTRLWRIEVHSQ